MIIFIFTLIVAVSATQAILSSVYNRTGRYGIFIFTLGISISFLWVMLSKYSQSLLRDGLIWDMLIAMVFSVVMILMGHGASFTIKHWIGCTLTFGVFLYWTLLK